MKFHHLIGTSAASWGGGDGGGGGGGDGGGVEVQQVGQHFDPLAFVAGYGSDRLRWSQVGDD